MSGNPLRLSGLPACTAIATGLESRNAADFADSLDANTARYLAMLVRSLISAGNDMKGGWIVGNPTLRHVVIPMLVKRRRIHLDRCAMAACGPVKPFGLPASIAGTRRLNRPLRLCRD